MQWMGWVHKLHASKVPFRVDEVFLRGGSEAGRSLFLTIMQKYFHRQDAKVVFAENISFLEPLREFMKIHLHFPIAPSETNTEKGSKQSPKNRKFLLQY
jgi:hypothetical protein